MVCAVMYVAEAVGFLGSCVRREASTKTTRRSLKPRMSEPDVTAAPAAAALPVKAGVLGSGSCSSTGRQLPPPALRPFITIPNNYDGDKQMLLAPAPEAKVDSDLDGEDGHSANTKTDVMAKRNTKYMQKHGVLMRQSTVEGAGCGLFASERLPVGRLLPLKGPWYQPLPYPAMVASNSARVGNLVGATGGLGGQSKN